MFACMIAICCMLMKCLWNVDWNRDCAACSVHWLQFQYKAEAVCFLIDVICSIESEYRARSALAKFHT